MLHHFNPAVAQAAYNIDLINDQIPFEASMDAFVKFAGNIREMHDEKKAVGRMVSFRR